MLKYSSRHLARLVGAVVFALAGVPAHGQSWNLYGNGGSFFVPITSEPNVPRGGPPTYYVSLTLTGNTTNTNNFILDTGSLGLVATSAYYSCNPAQGCTDKQLSPYATITYTTSSNNPTGALYLTNVQINGANGQSVTARVPILADTTNSPMAYHQLGVGFDRGGIMIGPNANSLTPANNSYQMNPFLALVSGSRRQHHAAGLHHQPERREPGRYARPQQPEHCRFLVPAIDVERRPAARLHDCWHGLPAQLELTERVDLDHDQRPDLRARSGEPAARQRHLVHDRQLTGQHRPDRLRALSLLQRPGQPRRQTACKAARYRSTCRGQTTPAYTFTLGDGTNPSTPFGVQVTRRTRGPATSDAPSSTTSTTSTTRSTASSATRPPAPTARPRRSSRCWRCRAT